MDPSVSTILQPRVRSPSTTSTLFNLYLICYEKRTKKNKRRPGLANLYKEYCHQIKQTKICLRTNQAWQTESCAGLFFIPTKFLETFFQWAIPGIFLSFYSLIKYQIQLTTHKRKNIQSQTLLNMSFLLWPHLTTTPLGFLSFIFRTW